MLTPPIRSVSISAAATDQETVKPECQVTEEAAAIAAAGHQGRKRKSSAAIDQESGLAAAKRDLVQEEPLPGSDDDEDQFCPAAMVRAQSRRELFQG
jgi:hypothetical protein